MPFKRDLTRWALSTICLMLCQTAFLYAKGAVGADSPESPLTGRESKYSNYDSPLRISFVMTPTGAIESATGELFGLKSDNGIFRAIFMDWDKKDGRLLLLFHAEHKMKRYFIENVDLNVASRVSIGVDFVNDLIELAVNDQTAVIKGALLTADEGYAYSLLPALSAAGPGDDPVFAVENLTVSVNRTASKGALWGYFLILLANVTVILSLVIHRQIRRRRAGRTKDDILNSDAFGMPELPLTGAIYIFGGLKVYDRRGENITRQMSPMLTELLSLLIINSNKQGISSAKLTGLLWSDMSPESARNNRAVYFSKLRKVLSAVGDITIDANGSYWKINCSSNVFVDYLYYKEKIDSPEEFSRENIGGIVSIARNGNVLLEMDYVWLDDVKGEVSNEILDKLLAYGESEAVRNNPVIYYTISEIISKLDRFNEDALVFRCKAYVLLGRHQSAKNYYDRFCAEYKSVYKENYPVAFIDIAK